MFKITWKYMALSVIVAATGAGAYHYITPAAIGHSVPPSATVPPARAPSAPRDEDVERKILDGIGSIKDLKPVQQQPALRQ
ncbi:hypothetical protein ABL841_30315 [Variovorax paradoxus]|uniref:hypothetical protein n=1 Tax=Variovorax paradoxus TaxID=34073 RepID=UPI0012BCEAA7|nr:hypothetical protein [Variovorax paradoxus]